MKHNGLCLRLTAIVLVLMLVISCGGVLAEESVSSCPAAESETVAALLKVPDFKFFVREKGIGKGSCPIYTAPSEDSLRLSDGNAVCNVETEISVGGVENGWLMVRCEIKDKKARVGYIPPSNVSGFRSKMGTKQFDYVAATAGGTIYVTDDPIRGTPYFARMDYGERFYLLARYDYYGDWLYIEFWVNGQVARGFIDRTSSNFSLY